MAIVYYRGDSGAAAQQSGASDAVVV